MKITRILALALVLVMAFTCTALAETAFPLVTEPTTITIMAQVASSYPDQDFGKVSGMIKYEEMTGVDVIWQNVDSEVFSSQVAALIASDDELPEVIMKGGFSNANLADWGSEGILVDLAPYIEEYMPNFHKLMQENDTIGGAILTEDGKIYGLPQIILGAEMRTPTKFWVNKKAMEKIGKDDPKTLDELVDVLSAALSSDWNGNGEADEVGVVASVGNMHNYFYGSFGLRNRGAHHDVVDVDPDTGALRVFATDDNYRAYLEFMKKMYSEKLIYPEIFTEGDKQASVFAASERLTVLLNTVAPSVSADLLGDWYPLNWSLEGPYGDAFHTQTRGTVHSTGNLVITEDCPEEKIPLILQWADYFYSEEGSQLVLVGVEGQDWEVKEDGSKGWTEAALALRTESMADSAFRSLFGLWPSGKVPACFYSNLFSAEYDPLPAACAQALLKDYAPEKIWPNINYTDAESEVISTVGTDINNYMKSFAAQVMTGEVELTDASWESFKKTINDMGVDKLLAAYVSALTRVYGEGAAF